MNKVWFLLDRIKEKWLRFYRKKVFMQRIGNHPKGINILGKIYVNASNITIGDNVNIYPGVYFWGDGEIIIGDNVDIGVGTIIFAKTKVVIGDNTVIAGQCYIIDSNHSVKKDQLIRNQHLITNEAGVVIGEDVWIAAGCKIISGAKIGNGSVIGAMSMVNSEIESFGIAVGIPAKVIKYRN